MTIEFGSANEGNRYDGRARRDDNDVKTSETSSGTNSKKSGISAIVFGIVFSIIVFAFGDAVATRLSDYDSTATGTITHVDYRYNSQREVLSSPCKAEFSYVADNGVTYEITPFTASSSDCSFKEGQEVGVSYSSSNPDDAMITSEISSAQDIVGILKFVGPAIALFGIFSLVSSIRRKKSSF